MLIWDMSNDQIQEVIEYARNSAIEEYNNQPWYQKNPDISVPLVIIGIGLFQFVIRKWLLRVSRDTIDELEDQLPTQGLIYQPGFGVALMIIGVILLVIFNLTNIL